MFSLMLHKCEVYTEQSVYADLTQELGSSSVRWEF